MKKLSSFIKVLAIISVIQISSFIFSNISYADFNNMPIAIYSDDVRVDLDTSLVANKRLMASPSYDIRNDILINAQRRHQGTTDTCWTFSSLAVLESYLALQEALNGTNKNDINYYDFSEMHMDYATSSYAGTNTKGYNKEINNGGNPFMAFSYMTRGSGPVLESSMPFMESQPSISLNIVDSIQPVKKIVDWCYFPSISKERQGATIVYKNGDTVLTEEQALKIRKQIKEHIIKYGAVTAATTNPNYSQYYNATTFSYCCDNAAEESNHQVTIIGWDDTYSKNNFNTSHKPLSNGAYIVLNSWGESFGDNGVYYISYEDVNIESFSLGIKNVSDIDYDYIYQHDPLGIDTTIPINANTVYAANVFEKQSDKNEVIKEISISAFSTCSCDVYINAESGEFNVSKFQKVNNSIITLEPGYTTIKLENPIKITGNKFVVMVKYTSNNGVVRVGVEAPIAGETGYWDTATSSAGESYLSDDLTKFYDLAVDFPYLKNANLCIKAFTQEIQSDIISQKYEINENYIKRIPPNTTVNDFIGKCQTTGQIEVYNQSGTKLGLNDYIGTGMTIKVTKNNKESQRKASVIGDLNGDGKFTLIDISRADLAFVKEITLENEFAISLDMNNDGKFSLIDISQFELYFLNIMQFER